MAYELRAEADLSAGDGHWTLAVVSEIVRREPGRERLAAALMRAQQLTGDIAGALSTFDSVRRYLADELGVDPGPELVALHRSAVRREDEPRVRTWVPRQLPAAVPDLSGRSSELADFKRVLTSEPEGTGAAQILAMHGMGGVGKTALAIGLGHELRDCPRDRPARAVSRPTWPGGRRRRTRPSRAFRHRSVTADPNP